MTGIQLKEGHAFVLRSHQRQEIDAAERIHSLFPVSFAFTDGFFNLALVRRTNFD